jgi:hypothetical protein
MVKVADLGGRLYVPLTRRPLNTQGHLMSDDPLYLVVESGRAMNAFTDKHDLRAFLWRMYRTLNKPLVYRIDDGEGPVIMTVPRALGRGLDK